MSNPITNARALLASRDATSKFSGYPDRKLADAMRELLAEVERMRAEEARCLDAADAATREDERRHAEFVKAAMDRERLLEAERDEARAEADRYRLALESLTPGGSEFHRNPERCVDVVREMKREPGRIVSQLRSDVERLRAQAQAIELALGAGEHLVDRSGTEPRWRTLPEAIAAVVAEVERLRALTAAEWGEAGPPGWEWFDGCWRRDLDDNRQLRVSRADDGGWRVAIEEADTWGVRVSGIHRWALDAMAAADAEAKR